MSTTAGQWIAIIIVALVFLGIYLWNHRDDPPTGIPGGDGT